MTERFWGTGLYAITPDCADTNKLTEQVRAALAGGVRLLQYRNKTAPTELREEQATVLQGLCRLHGARFIVNDDLALALVVGADGLHLGRDDGALSIARVALGPMCLLGVSCYADLSRAQEAEKCGANYVAFGSIFPSATKPQAVHAPLTLLAQAKSELDVPVVAIGGITLENAPSVLEAGADLLAVITDLFDAPDITEKARAYVALFNRQREHS
jgi:thiamine-phosphate pyrophosphorylase